MRPKTRLVQWTSYLTMPRAGVADVGPAFLAPTVGSVIPTRNETIDRQFVVSTRAHRAAIAEFARRSTPRAAPRGAGSSTHLRRSHRLSTRCHGAAKPRRELHHVGSLRTRAALSASRQMSVTQPVSVTGG